MLATESVRVDHLFQIRGRLVACGSMPTCISLSWTSRIARSGGCVAKSTSTNVSTIRDSVRCMEMRIGKHLSRSLPNTARAVSLSETGRPTMQDAEQRAAVWK